MAWNKRPNKRRSAILISDFALDLAKATDGWQIQDIGQHIFTKRQYITEQDWRIIKALYDRAVERLAVGDNMRLALPTENVQRKVGA